MKLEIASIDTEQAVAFLAERKCVLPDSCEPLFAVAVKDDGGEIHGAILMGSKDGDCELLHVYGDGLAQVQTLLYGAAWRAAKALGYKRVVI